MIQTDHRPPAARWSMACILVALFMTPVSVEAQTKTETDRELAKRYYKLGEELFMRSAYDEALTQFEKSYRFSNRAPLLYNMARCHESLGRYERAILLYKQYLNDGKPNNPAPIQLKIRNLEELLAKKQKHAIDVERNNTQPPTQKHQKKSTVMKIAGWSLVGLGGASLAAGIVLGALAQGEARELEDANRGGEVYSAWQDTESRGEALEIGQVVGLVVGGAALATGVVLLVLDRRSGSDERQAWVAPGVSRRGAGLAAGFAF